MPALSNPKALKKLPPPLQQSTEATSPLALPSWKILEPALPHPCLQAALNLGHFQVDTVIGAL